MQEYLDGVQVYASYLGYSNVAIAISNVEIALDDLCDFWVRISPSTEDGWIYKRDYAQSYVDHVINAVDMVPVR